MPAMPPSTGRARRAASAEPAGVPAAAPQRRFTVAVAEAAAIDTAIRRAREWTAWVACGSG